MQQRPPFAYGAGFRSLTREIADPVALPVAGELPTWLEGVLLRTGPSKFEVGDRTYNHWFDGLAMLHRFAFSRGAVTYANRFLQSNAYRAAETAGRISYGEFATDPCRTLFGRVAAIFVPKLTDNCCVNISAYARQAVAFTETSIPMRLSPKTLDTLGVFGYRRALRGQVSTAHPHYDAARARHYNYVADLGLSSVYRFVSIGDNGRQRLVAKIPAERPAYMHSFGMSERYLVLTEFPLVVNPIDLRLSGKPFIQNYRWQPARGLVFHVVEKDSGRLVKTVKTDALFAFHHVNAVERGGALDIDLVAYDDATIIDELYLARLRAGTPISATGKLIRLRILVDGSDDVVTRRTLADVPLELPRINYEKCAGKSYRYVWGVGIKVEGDFLDCIVKIDTETGQANSWHFGGLYPGEPVFVPSPGAKDEDDGVLLSIVLDIERERSFLLVLDAATLKELARAEAPHAIPFHFHGNYFAARH